MQRSSEGLSFRPQGSRSPSRARSLSEDSGDERRGQRRRREASSREDWKGRSSYGEEKYGESLGRRDRYGESHRKRRRSRSPAEDSYQRRRYDKDSTERFRRSSSPQHHSTRDVDRSSAEKVRQHPSSQRQGNGDRHMKYLESSSEKQVSREKNKPLPSQAELFSMTKNPSSGDKPTAEKEKPNLNPTGLLALASNTVTQADGTSIVLKYHEPPEARKPPPKDQWKLFVFKGANIIETIELGIRSCWLIGREISVVDLPAEHPSISKQHAVIQFRWIEKRNEFGDTVGKVKPYLIDLESANGTILNKELIPASRYLELRDKDLIQFGESTREYVLMLPPRD
jgi:smad nuclear-interacting protein 1